MHVVLVVTGGEALCHIINQGFCKHTESPTQKGLIRIHVCLFFKNIWFHLRTIISYGFIVICVLLLSALLFCCHVSSSSSSLCSVKLNPDYL